MQALAADFSGYAEDSAAVFRDQVQNRLSGSPYFNNRSIRSPLTLTLTTSFWKITVFMANFPANRRAAHRI